MGWGCNRMKTEIKLAGLFGFFALYVVALKTLIDSNYIGYIITFSGIGFLFIVLVWVLEGIEEED